MADILERTEVKDITPEQSAWLFGDCLSYAVAYQQLNPELEIGVIFYGNPEDKYTEQHVIAHSKDTAYDASGAMPLADAIQGTFYRLHLDADYAANIVQAPRDFNQEREARSFIKSRS